MSDAKYDTEVEIIRSAILNFIDEMKKEKRSLEQQIREKTENIRSSTLSSGSSQFSYQDVDGLSRTYKDEFLSFYRNTIHLKLIANASDKIKHTIENGLLNADIVQQEWLESIRNLQNQVNNYQGMAQKASELETELEGSIAKESDLENLQAIIAEKDQLLAEKDQEIMNLNEGLTRMENQVNSMGQTMLQNSMTIEELQEAINDRDEEISRLKEELSTSAQSSAEIDTLREQLKQAQERERELQIQSSSASEDLVGQLQDDLEQARKQVLELRKDVVAKNEELHDLKLEHNETDLKIKQLQEQIEELQTSKNQISTENEQLEKELQSVQNDKQELQSNLEEKKYEVNQLSQNLDATQNQLSEIQEKLKGYEGKVAISQEEKDKISKQVTFLKEELENYKEVIEFFNHVLGSDVKYRTMILISSIDEEIKLDDLADSIGVPKEITQRAIIELSEEGILESRKEGRNIYCKTKEGLEKPLALQVD